MNLIYNKRMKKLSREDFFGSSHVQKLTNQINKKTLGGFNYLYLKDKKLIKYLQTNKDWLDYVGICLIYKKDKKMLMVKWETIL